MKKTWVLAVILSLVLIGCLGAPNSGKTTAVIEFPDGFQVTAEVARSAGDKANGLSGRQALGEDEGMLFVYDEPCKPGFWMPGMNFPLDMVFLDENFTVVGVNANAQPCKPNSACPFYHPKENALYVLEVNANTSAEHGAVEGAVLELSFPE